MKLAEALLTRSQMQTKVAKLRLRIGKAAMVQEGDSPQESAEALLRECAGVLEELHQLIARIHRTNHAQTLTDGRTLAQVMAERDRLRQLLSLLEFTATKATTSPDSSRYSAREIKWVPTIQVTALYKQIDDVSGKLRTLNAMLQEANWKVELSE